MPKPIDSLSPSDLQRHHVWEYATDEEDGDETYVQSLLVDAVPNAQDYSVYHVACEIVTATGKRFTGFMSISGGGFQDTAPIVVGDLGNYWPLDVPPARRRRIQFEAFFGAEYAHLFPIRWSLAISIEGEPAPRSGVFHGA